MFTLANPISSSGYFKISLTSGMGQSGNSKISCSISPASAIVSPGCAINDEGTRFSLSTKSLITLPNALNSGQTIVLKVANIINPPESGFSGVIKIQSFYSSAGDLVDEFSENV